MTGFRTYFTFTVVICALMVITFHNDVIAWYRQSSYLRGGVSLKNEDSYKHHAFTFNRKNTNGGSNIKSSKAEVVSPDGMQLQGTIKDNVDAVIYSAYPDLLSPKAYPKKYSCPGTHRTITITSSPWNAAGIGNADVVFFGVEVSNIQWEQVTKERKPHQIWVYTTGESAYYAPQVRPKDGVKPLGFGQDFRFNMSVTYHSKSEIVATYGSYIPFTEKDQKRNANIKSKIPNQTVAWVSSHCDKTFWNRTGFVQSLSNYIPIHTYGRCGDKPLRGSAKVAIMKGYKFYIAFENSCCSEFITEKFWQALTHYESVPIVIGASKSEYQRVAPPNSFVFANDFNSAEDLARYIRVVANNETLYNKYHEWRKYGQVVEMFGGSRIYSFTSSQTACIFLKFLEQNAWKGNNKPLSTKLDPFGPEWLGSCKPCGDKKWINIFDLSSDGYNPIVYLHTTFYKFSDPMKRIPYKGHVPAPKLV